MVSRAGHYYGTLFKGYMGVMWVNPMSTIILNMVVDVVICHWAIVVSG